MLGSPLVRARFTSQPRRGVARFGPVPTRQDGGCAAKLRALAERGRGATCRRAGPPLEHRPRPDAIAPGAPVIGVLVRASPPLLRPPQPRPAADSGAPTQHQPAVAPCHHMELPTGVEYNHTRRRQSCHSIDPRRTFAPGRSGDCSVRAGPFWSRHLALAAGSSAAECRRRRKPAATRDHEPTRRTDGPPDRVLCASCLHAFPSLRWDRAQGKAREPPRVQLDSGEATVPAEDADRARHRPRGQNQ